MGGLSITSPSSNGRSPSAARAPSALRVTGVSKRYGATLALGGVDFELRPGEIHALLGSNGAGKSTLIKILGGVETADGGELEVFGRCLDARQSSPELANRLGFRFVHQQDSTFSQLSVTENLAARDNFVTAHAGRIDWRAMRRRAQELLDRFGIDADPDQMAGELRPVSRRMLAIARALQDLDGEEGGILVLDEPSAGLPGPEVATLHQSLREFSEAGQSIVYVTHLLDELPGFADRATVIRDGRVAGTVEAEELNEDSLVELICGRPLQREPRRQLDEGEAGGALLEFRGVSGGPIDRVDLALGAGEVVGIAGIAGSGRTSLLKMAFGLESPSAGDVLVEGKPLIGRRATIDPRIAFVPEDRNTESAFQGLTVRENLSAARVGDFVKRVRLRHRLEAEASGEAIRRFRIRAASDQMPFEALSGGNQQKVILARWMERHPRVLLLDEPSSGVDVGARNEIHRLIAAAADEGSAVLVASSDFEELCELCDKVVVLARGRKVAEVPRSDLNPTTLEELTYGAGINAGD